MTKKTVKNQLFFDFDHSDNGVDESDCCSPVKPVCDIISFQAARDRVLREERQNSFQEISKLGLHLG